jgi:hypothetical protein
MQIIVIILMVTHTFKQRLRSATQYNLRVHSNTLIYRYEHGLYTYKLYSVDTISIKVVQYNGEGIRAINWPIIGHHKQTYFKHNPTTIGARRYVKWISASRNRAVSRKEYSMREGNCFRLFWHCDLDFVQQKLLIKFPVYIVQYTLSLWIYLLSTQNYDYVNYLIGQCARFYFFCYRITIQSENLVLILSECFI